MNHPILYQILESLRFHYYLILGDKLERIYLYGSQARGDASPGSDIDILIVIRDEFDYFDMMSKTSDITWRLSLENDVVISRVFISKSKFDQENTPFLMNVHREAIPV
jgi:predicted nucleotidyltransferase